MKSTGLLFICLVIYSGIWAQPNVNSLGFPSPNNDFLGGAATATGVGVDAHTGTALVSVPICNLVSKDLSVPVSLQYTAGRGVKVQDFATSTGLGWQLNGGGNISRVVRGFPDEIANGYLGTGLIGQKLENYYNAVPGATFPAGVNNGLNVPTSDGEPDIYYVRTPYFGFQFTFDGNGNPVFNNETGIKITSSAFYNTSNFQNSSFTVTDATGNVYSFGGTIERSTTTLYGTSYTFISTWYLTQISTFNSRDNVYFFYINAPGNDVLNHYQYIRTYNMYGCQDNAGSDPIPLTIIQPKYLASIYCGNGQIDFSYVYDRRDITTAARLSNVVLKSNGVMGLTTLQSYSFNYSYFNDPTTDVNLLRLRLDNIQLAGGTTATSTPITYRSFTYNSTNLPSRTSQNFDYWGYYKSFVPIANPDPMADPTLRGPNEFNTKASILTSIQEMTGATWSLVYELNTYYKTSGGTNANVYVGGLRVQSVSKTLATGELLQTTYQYNDNTGKSTGQISTEAYANLVLFIAGLTRIYSECPAQVYDINGTFIGYSSVKAINQNGGYTVSEFYNFSDFPDIFDYSNPADATNAPAMTSSVSYAYKRGLVKSQAVYNAAGTKLSEDINSFTSLNTPSVKMNWAFRWYVAAAAACGSGASASIYSKYYVNVENYRLAGTTHKDYDQVTPANFIQTSVAYTYCPNKRSIKTETTTDSKGNTTIKTYYHSHDTGIPMVAGDEPTAIASLVSLNNLDALVHETDTRNSAINHLHNIYSVGVGGSTKPYMTGSAAYRGTNLLNTQSYIYEPGYSNLVTSNATGGKPASILYGYNNNSYPVGQVSNASSFYTVQQSSGGFGGTITSSYSVSFTVDYTGNVGFSLYPMGATSSVNISYTLTGPSGSSGSGCIAGGCSSYYSTVIPNRPPGYYTIYINVSGTGGGSGFYCTGSYPKNGYLLNNEYYYESFETFSGGISGSAHTGIKYWDASINSFPINYTPPNSRNYIIQWWKWVGGSWKFNEAPYTGPTSLSGVIDDVRIFPEDAQMVTFTYDPMVGKTGETDPGGRTVTYEYDGLGRTNIVRDDDKNIVTKNCYNYLGQVVACPVATNFTNVAKSGTFTRNNCSPGFLGTSSTYNVAAGIYTSSISQADADQMAVNDVNSNGQNYANTNGTCYQIWYNVQKSGTFTRNNCGSGSTGSSVTYTVAASMYSSLISQADADQKAQDDVNNNGQAFANANGTCSSASCSFSLASGFGSPYNSISQAGGSVSFSIVFYSTSSPITLWSSYQVATISAACAPASTRTMTLTSGSNTFSVTIYSNGQFWIQMTGGSTINPGSTSYLSSSYVQ